MQRLTRHIAVAALLLSLLGVETTMAQILPSFGGDRAGTSGWQFLKVPVDARSSGMSQSVVSTAADASSLYWNPALAAQARGNQVGVSHTEYFADVTLDYVGAIYHVGAFTLGASLQTLNSGEMDVTTEFEPFGTGETFRVIDVAAGLTVAQALTDLFSYGVTAKLVQESFAGIDSRTFLVDLGIFYRIGNTGAQMAVAVKNFGLDGTPSGSIERIVIGESQPVLEDDFESITPPTSFLLGVSYDVFTSRPNADLNINAQLSNPNDNAENWNFGAEYVWNQTLALRTGYRFGVDEATIPSFGLGVYVPYLGPRLRFDYGFNKLEKLGSVHRVGLNLAF